MPSASRAMLLCGVFVALTVVPSQQGKARGRGTSFRQSFVAAHDPGVPLHHRQHQCLRHPHRPQRCQTQQQQQDTRLFSAFAVLPRQRPHSRRPHRVASAEITPRFATSTTSTYFGPSEGRRRRRRHDSRHPLFQSTLLIASEPSPGDESYSPQVLSPAEILEFVKRVDFFDLPPGGLTAGEAGYQKALPVQVGYLQGTVEQYRRYFGTMVNKIAVRACGGRRGRSGLTLERCGLFEEAGRCVLGAKHLRILKYAAVSFLHYAIGERLLIVRNVEICQTPQLCGWLRMQLSKGGYLLRSCKSIARPELFHAIAVGKSVQKIAILSPVRRFYLQWYELFSSCDSVCMNLVGDACLAFQVLECIRHRHGLQEFAGGRLLLDPEYEFDETAESAPDAAASASEDNDQEGDKGLLFPGLRLLHAEPIVIGVDDFFTPEECDDYISRSVSPTQREYFSRAGMGPFEQPAVLDKEQVRERVQYVRRTASEIDPNQSACRLKETGLRVFSFSTQQA